MFLKRKKMLADTMTQFINKKYIMEENLVRIESNVSTKGMVSLLEYVKNAQKEIRMYHQIFFNLNLC